MVKIRLRTPLIHFLSNNLDMSAYTAKLF